MFLAFDSIEEAFDVSKENLAGIFNGGLLIITITVLSFIGLYYSGERFLKKAETSKFSKPLAIALMISIGIGLHNFGEGLAIGSAVSLGSLAFSTFLIVGFAIHNTTEGIAIASPISKDTSMTRKKMIEKLFMLGLIAGSPAIFGVWIGGFVYSPFTSVIFLSIGAGAIFQVIITILKWIMQDQENSLSSTPVVSGIGVGMVVMYLTSILV